jgi:AbrB family looped-hinge helix DNA binding protein
MRQYLTRVGPKGQVTLPVEVRRELGISPKDNVYIEVAGDRAMVRRAISSVMELKGSIRPLKKKLTPRQVHDIAMEELAPEAAHKGLD